jgi:hypothetical protein
MSRRKKVYEDDDGRTYANMNVDGMPWYSPERKNNQSPGFKAEELDKAGKRALLGGVLAAALLVAFIFIAAFFLFILLWDKVLLP